MKDYKGKVGGVTGAANGIGKGFALYAASLGMKLALIDIEGENLEKVKAECEAAGAEKVIAIQADLTEKEQVQMTIDRMLEEFGHIDLFYSNAGVATGGTIDKLPLKEWDWVYAINTLAMSYYATILLSLFTKQGTEADLIFTSSIGGEIMGASYQTAYTCSKHATSALAEACAHYAENYAPFIHVTCFCPEYINTTIWNGPARRPERFYEEGNPFYESADYLDYLKAFRGRIEDTGYDPKFVGPRIFQALEEGQIFIFPHMHSHEWIKARIKRVEDCMKRDEELDAQYKELEGRK